MGDYPTCLLTIGAGQMEGIRPLVSLGFRAKGHPFGGRASPPNSPRGCQKVQRLQRSYLPTLYKTSLCHPHTPTEFAPPSKIPLKHMCIENQWEYLTENLENWIFDEIKTEFLRRKQCAKNTKLQIQTPQALHSLLSHAAFV